MGFLRTLLAVVVVLNHTGGPELVGGRNAVQMFYVISGFLISYVLVDRKAYPSVAAFYVNRYLRLWPIYAVVALATLAALLFQRDSAAFWNVLRASPWSARALLVVTNAILFGQDWVMFLGVRAHHLELVKDFRLSDPILYPGLLAQQAWTLGVELTFYLVAPFLLPRRKWIYICLAASLLLRLCLSAAGFGLTDPWTYRFFPTELALFLFGALSQQLLLARCQRLSQQRQRGFSSAATGLLTVLVLSYQWIPLDEWIKTLLLLAVFIPCVPLLFIFQGRHRLDRAIGDLSYPVYINHMLVLMGVSALFVYFGVHNKAMVCVVSVVSALAFAYVLEIAVGLPIEKLRRAIKRRSKARAFDGHETEPGHVRGMG